MTDPNAPAVDLAEVLTQKITAKYPTLNELRGLAAEKEIDLGSERTKVGVTALIVNAVIENGIAVPGVVDSKGVFDEESIAPSDEPVDPDNPPAGPVPDVQTTIPPEAEEGDQDFQMPTAKLDYDYIHVVRKIVPDGAELLGVGDAMLTATGLSAFLKEEYFDRGYAPEFIDYMGVDESSRLPGHNFIFLMKQVGEENAPNELSIKLQALSPGNFGFNANMWLDSLVGEGWDLKHFKHVTFSENQVFCVWVLTR